MKQTEQTLDITEWCKPALVVLVRLKPEESVLTGCKIGDEMTPGPDVYWKGCKISGCLDCNTHVSS
jgi:hypothetical protein